MVLIVLLNILLYLLLKDLIVKFDKKEQKKLYLLLGIGLLIELFLLIIYRYDLVNIGRIVYYSDAETYWRNTLEIINYGTSSGYNSLYYICCAFLQLTSPFLWVGWNNIFNITCINYIIYFVISIIVKRNDKEIYEKTKLIIITIMYNPFIIYSLMRNLKDALFTLMVVVTAYLYNYYYECMGQKMKILTIIGLMAMTYLFILIRPWAFIISLLAIMLIIIHKLKTIKYAKFLKNFIKNNLVGTVISGVLLLSIIILVVPIIFVNLKVWIPTVMQTFFSRNIFLTLLGVIKLIFAPGPIRCLFGNKFFIHYTTSGNIMTFIGSIMWWISIIYLVAILYTNRKNLKIKDKFVKFILYILIIFISLYTIQYAGSVELRLHSTLYILIYIIIFTEYKINNIDFKDKNIRSLIIIFLLFYIALSIVSWGGSL